MRSTPPHDGVNSLLPSKDNSPVSVQRSSYELATLQHDARLEEEGGVAALEVRPVSGGLSDDSLCGHDFVSLVKGGDCKVRV